MSVSLRKDSKSRWKKTFHYWTSCVEVMKFLLKDVPVSAKLVRTVILTVGNGRSGFSRMSINIGRCLS